MSFHHDYERWERMTRKESCPVCSSAPMPEGMVDVVELPASWLNAQPDVCLRGQVCVTSKVHAVEQQELQARRDECAIDVPPTALAIFNRVAEHHDGQALAPVVKLHPKRDEYVCSGCNMKLTLEVINALRSRDEVQECKVCGRILHIETPATQRSGT